MLRYINTFLVHEETEMKVRKNEENNECSVTFSAFIK